MQYECKQIEAIPGRWVKDEEDHCEMVVDLPELKTKLRVSLDYDGHAMDWYNGLVTLRCEGLDPSICGKMAVHVTPPFGRTPDLAMMLLDLMKAPKFKHQFMLGFVARLQVANLLKS